MKIILQKTRGQYQTWTHNTSVLVADAYLWKILGRMKYNLWYNRIWRISK